MENLPNVFIDKIVVNAHDTGYRYEIKLCMYDHRPKRSWSNRDDLTGLRIKIALISGNTNNLQALNSGADSLQSYTAEESGTSSNYFVQIINSSEFTLETEEETRGFSKFTKIVTFDLVQTLNEPAYSNFNVYAACFIDFGVNFDLGSDFLNKFYGPMSGEKIFVGGQLNKDSGYFYYPDTNEEYGGPVHGHDGILMEGSQHSNRPHSRLVYVSEDNYKIIEPLSYALGGLIGGGNSLTNESFADQGSAGPSQGQGLENESTANQGNSGMGDAAMGTGGQSGPSGPSTPGGPQSGAGNQARQDALSDLEGANFEIQSRISGRTPGGGY